MAARKHVPLTATLVLLAAAGVARAQAAPDAGLSAAALQQRGHDLHRDVLAEYKRLRPITRRNSPDVSALVSKYIPPGTSFHDAMAILDAAGRWHRRHPPQTGQLEPNTAGDIFVFIPLPNSIFAIAAGYSCGITLTPSVPGEFATVGKVRASITVNYL